MDGSLAASGRIRPLRADNPDVAHDPDPPDLRNGSEAAERILSWAYSIGGVRASAQFVSTCPNLGSESPSASVESAQGASARGQLYVRGGRDGLDFRKTLSTPSSPRVGSAQSRAVHMESATGALAGHTAKVLATTSAPSRYTKRLNGTRRLVQSRMLLVLSAV